MSMLVMRYRQGGGRNLWWWCPGCSSAHMVTVPDDSAGVPAAGPLWTWDGNVDRPTIGPSVKVTGGPPEARTICHLFLVDGRLQFLTDCTHELAGQTVAMVAFPEGYLP